MPGSTTDLGSSLGTAVAGTILVAQLVDWSYGLAMGALAAVGVVGLVAALMLARNGVAEAAGVPPA